MSRAPWVIATALLCWTGPTQAGALNSVVGGLKHRSGQDDSSKKEESTSETRDHRASSSDSSSSSDSGPTDSGSSWVGHSSPHHTSTPGFFVGAYPYPTSGPGTDVRVYLGLHSVEASDGATAVALRVSHGDLGLEIDDTTYYERDQRYTSGYLTMDMWTLGLAYRGVRPGADERTAVWLKGGLAGTTSAGLDILGAMVGAELAHNITPSLGVDCSGRLFAYQDGIRAIELRAGAAASILRLSYRLLQFNVGPPLRGPEIGIALSF